MEIVQGTAGEGGGGEGAGGEAAGGEGGAAAPDIGALLEGFGSKLDEFGTSFGQRLEQLETPAGGAAAGEGEGGGGTGGEGEGGEIATPQFGVEDYDEDGFLTTEAQTRAVQEIAQRAVAESLAPIHAAQQEERRQAEAEALEEKYPDLKNEEKVNELFETAGREAQRLAQVTGRSELAELDLEPAFLETVYLRMQAEARAGGEIPAGSEREVHIEGGHGGAGPAGASGEDDGDKIVALAGKSRFRLGR